MLHPSYNDLIKAVNSDDADDAPVINSRYSIVLATAKRARQIIDGSEPLVGGFGNDDKPLSIAIAELNSSKVKILSESDDEDIPDGENPYGDELPEDDDDAAEDEPVEDEAAEE